MPNEVLFEKIDTHIALVTLNRPEAYNAINAEVTHLMEDIVQQTEEDRDIRAVILTGAGEKAFSAGADLKLIAAGKGHLLHSETNGFGGFVYAQRSKPWIAAVDGFALAGGTEFCLACDMIVASEKSKFGLPEVTKGLIAGAGGLFRLPQVIPQKIALELICTGDMLNADRAFALGLVNHLTSSEEVLPKAREIAEKIAANSPNSIRESLHFIKTQLDKPEKEIIAASNVLFDRILKSEDAQEGTLSFVEKRKPNWH
ncbi:enoyl-CoA hydratase/isomerase family protein [Marinilongibacter aquaticus]|uniref:enoyl-CoA hydratase-related protein n=1 Tax=Marinilongibacter aquaticus TaxID=2975157 RepID=UPI0021BDBCD1|nr:enoyl-CoA hydratase-related protein [Marinilongibacter aquaticus]UBM58147.1 enoyl-CoA hydratase/isomerase family protein [Marinilongibacter aquaticus]